MNNYEEMIKEMSKRIAQLSIENAKLIVRNREEIRNKELIDEKYVEAMHEVRYYKEILKEHGIDTEE